MSSRRAFGSAARCGGRLASLWLALTVLACRPAATLDSTEHDGGETTSAASSTGDGSETDGAVMCAPGCANVLVPDWTYVGQGGAYEVAELVLREDQSFVAGVSLAGGGLRIVDLSADGQVRSSLSPQLQCQGCELVDIAVHPSGDVLVSATAPGVDEPPAAVLARFDPAAGMEVWSRAFAFSLGISVTQHRAGPIAIVEDDRIVQLRVTGFAEGEGLVLVEVDAQGNHLRTELVLDQPDFLEPWPRLAEAGPLGDLVIATPLWVGFDNPDLRATTRRLLAPNYGAVSRIELPIVLDDLAIDSEGQRIELAHDQGDSTVTFLLTSRAPTDIVRWEATLPLLSTSATRPTLAIGSDDHVYMAVRVTPRGPGDEFFSPELAVARWSPSGELLMQAAVPLELAASPSPIQMVVDSDDGIVVASVIRGRAHVTRYMQECTCE